MPRIYFLALFLTASALAQTNCPDRTCREITPITGIVTSATDGRLIAGAIVHYRGTANTSDEKGIVINPSSLQGQVITAADGRYTLPQLPFGDFIIRASAKGFFAGRKEIQPRLAGDRPQPVPVPAFLCRGSGRSYPCGVLPRMPSGDFKLQPDPMHLTAMSTAALDELKLPLPGYPNRGYLASSFSSDGNQLAFITLDRIAFQDVTKYVLPPFRRCSIWIYDLSTGRLSVPQDQAALRDACDLGKLQIVWDGNTPIVAQTDSSDPKNGIHLLRIQQDQFIPVEASSLPQATQRQLVHSAPPQNKAPSGLYKLDEVEEDEGQSTCITLKATSNQTHQSHILVKGCGDFEYLERNSDLVFFSDPQVPVDGSHPFAITEFSRKTGYERSFYVPVLNNNEPVFLAAQTLPNGTARFAYAVQGDCDPAASDYTQPGVPDNALGPTPNQFSVCFLTFPPVK